MEVNKTKALLKQHIASRLDFYTSKKANGQLASTLPFNAMLNEQIQTKVWSKVTENELQSAHQPLWAYLDRTGAEHVERYGHLGHLIERQMQSSHHFGTSQTSHSFSDIIQQASQKYGVDKSLIHAVIQTESAYRPDAVSSAGAKGLMQLMDGTAKGLGVTDSFDPVQNIEGGTRYLAMLLQKYNGQEQVALAAYNAGPGRVDRIGIKTNEELMEKLHLLPKETQRYIGKVLSAKV